MCVRYSNSLSRKLKVRMNTKVFFNDKLCKTAFWDLMFDIWTASELHDLHRWVQLSPPPLKYSFSLVACRGLLLLHTHMVEEYITSHITSHHTWLPEWNINSVPPVSKGKQIIPPILPLSPEKSESFYSQCVHHSPLHLSLFGILQSGLWVLAEMKENTEQFSQRIKF